jgi:CheY-like chemotaxis protein
MMSVAGLKPALTKETFDITFEFLRRRMMIKKILVVDDDPSSQRISRSILESGGYEVVSVNDGRDVLSAVRALRPDAVVMDLIMADVGGSEAVAGMQSDPQANSVPVLFLTAVNMSDGQSEGQFDIKVGERAYPTLTKPVHAPALLGALERILS